MMAAATLLQRQLPMAFSAYVLIVVALHLALPATWTWHIAYAALLGMLFTYPAHALLARHDTALETGLSVTFAVAGLIGFLIAPILLIAAIAAHGILDLVKKLGVGARVPTWYLLGCGVFDLGYAAFLFLHL